MEDGDKVAARIRRTIQRLTDEARTLRAAAEVASEEAHAGSAIEPVRPGSRSPVTGPPTCGIWPTSARRRRTR